MAKAKKNTNNTGLAGEFAVLSALNLRGWNASLTLGNTKGVDIVAFKDDTSKPVKIEVKTSSDSEKFAGSKIFGSTISWRMDAKHEEISNSDLFYCFIKWNRKVENLESAREDIFPIFYIVPSAVVAEYVKKEHVLWKETKEKDESFSHGMRNFRLADGKGEYKITTHKAEEYRNAWDLLLKESCRNEK